MHMHMQIKPTYQNIYIYTYRLSDGMPAKQSRNELYSLHCCGKKNVYVNS